ncbi:tyrosine-type recombinase/integrase [Variovorax humicola]|uniref:Tyrosine-type recombinase/integrase n=1 Tax=Variovorax humicola TaxID=1769758 RepID=A0ABU8W6G2_9BURK
MKARITESYVKTQKQLGVTSEIQDETEPSLRLYITAQNVLWGLYKWCPATGRPVRKSLGKWPDVTVDAARKKAKALSSEIGNGGTLAPKPKAMTLGELAQAYGKHLKAKKMKTWAEPEKIIERSFHDWLPHPVQDITKAKLSIRHDKITESRGAHAAARAVKVLRAIIAYANKMDLYMGANIAKAIDVVDSRPRTRVLTPSETSKILWSLQSPQWMDWVQPFFRLLLLTGVRRSNLSAARWADMDLSSGIWVIPAGESKNGRELEVVLLPEAVEILQEQKESVDESEWVFPSTRSDSGHLEQPHETWKQVLKLADVPDDITIHDLRRTYGSILVNAKVSMPIIAKALGHSNPATTARHYAHVNVESVREAWASVGK